jgi:hypothetical protein
MINPESIRLDALIPANNARAGGGSPDRIAMETVCFVTVAIACGGARYTLCTEKTGDES